MNSIDEPVDRSAAARERVVILIDCAGKIAESVNRLRAADIDVSRYDAYVALGRLHAATGA